MKNCFTIWVLLFITSISKTQNLPISFKAQFEQDQSNLFESITETSNSVNQDYRLIGRDKDNWDVNMESWLDYDSIGYVYNMDGLIYEDTRYKIENNLATPSWKSRYEYNEDGQITLETYYKRSNGDWQEKTKYWKTFDSNGNEIEEFVERFYNNVWQNNVLYSYTYDDNNQLIHHLWQVWEDDAWVNWWQITYEYENNNIILAFGESWDTGLMDWVNNGKVEFEYAYFPTDPILNIEKRTRFRWFINAWIEVEIITEEYDINEKLISIYLNKQVSGVWIDFERTLFDYDDNDNLVQQTKEIWSLINDDWGEATKWNWSYTEFDLPDNLLIKTRDEDTGKWSNDTREFYYYEPIVGLEMVENTNMEIELYPNPTTGLLNFSLEKPQQTNAFVQLFNGQGQILFQQDFKTFDSQILDLSDFNSGTYLFQVVCGDANHFQEIIVVK